LIVVAAMISFLIIRYRILYWYEYKVHYGMTMDQVISIMGEPDVKSGDDKRASWSYISKDSLVLDFDDGKLVYGTYRGSVKGNWIRSERDLLQPK